MGSDQEAEILCLRLHPGVSVRRIARAFRVSCWTVQRVLDRLRVPKAPGSVTRSPVVPT
jgi:hypothetical protein